MADAAMAMIVLGCDVCFVFGFVFGVPEFGGYKRISVRGFSCIIYVCQGRLVEPQDRC